MSNLPGTGMGARVKDVPLTTRKIAPWVARRASLTVVTLCPDAADAKEMLAMLGLVP